MSAAKKIAIIGAGPVGLAGTDLLMMTGYEQVRSIVADIAGDKEAAEHVELVLPETGVCSRAVTVAPEGEACCGGPALADATACCKADEAAKARGQDGCGCG